MVRGIEKFKEYFKDYHGQYVFIGGTACDIILGEQGVDFRATKDYDIVLIVEAINKEFVDQFIRFIKDGGYSHIRKSTGKDQFYRFEKTSNLEFPSMIELFSKKPDYISTIDTEIAPIHISDDMLSLSAILLNDDYYDLLKNNITNVNDLPVLNLEHIIIFKMKAYLDLKQRKADGEAIDSNDIKKHKKDVFRLIINVSGTPEVKVPKNIYDEIEDFLNEVLKDPIDFKELKLAGTFEEAMSKLKTIYKPV